MPADYLHNHPQFADLIRIVSLDKGIDPALVEKDSQKTMIPKEICTREESAANSGEGPPITPTVLMDSGLSASFVGLAPE
jgi:hypothetical protein